MLAKLRNLLSNIPGDLLGGLTAAIVALPIALAFGVASGLGAAAGLYGAIACGILAAMFGGTRAQVSGPTGPMTVVVAALVSANPNQPELIFAAVSLAGFCQMGLGCIKAGQLIEYIPYPVVSGFMTGIGSIIVVLQIRPLFGLASKGDAFTTLKSLPEILQSVDAQALGVGLICLLCIYLAPAAHKRIPAALVALIAGTAITVGFGLKIPTIAHIPAGMPVPKIPVFSAEQWHIVITYALSLATLGSIDSLLTSVVVDRLTKTNHNSNQELIGQGLGNLMAGIIGGLPGAGATMRSVINIKSGGKTPLSGMFHGLVLLAVLLGLGSFAERVPLSCLAAILISVGIGIIDYRALKCIRKAPKEDVLVMLVVLFHTIFVDLIIAVIAGLAMAALLFAKKMADTQLMSAAPVSNFIGTCPTIGKLPKEMQEQIFVYSFHGPLFFGEAKNLQRLVEGAPSAHFILLHFANVPFADQSGSYALMAAIEDWKKRDVRVIFVGLNKETKSIFVNLGLEVSELYESLAEAVTAMISEQRA